VDVARSLLDDGYKIAVIGSAREGPALRDAFATIECTYWLGLAILELASRLREATALVAIDSSVMNLADATGLPSVVVYNLTRPETHGPFDTRLVSLVCAGADSLGTGCYQRGDLARDRRGRRPAAADVCRAVASLA
jgi:ADP-heptose:LPS heptosyltransferase